MEPFTRDVVEYMDEHPDEVVVALVGAVQLCPHIAFKPNWLSDESIDQASRHVFTKGCAFCQRIFVKLLRQQSVF
jgi:hypothetical protein